MYQVICHIVNGEIKFLILARHFAIMQGAGYLPDLTINDIEKRCYKDRK